LLKQPKLFALEADFDHMKSLRDIVSKMFPLNWHFTLVHQEKNQRFYELILDDTYYVLFSHTPCKFDNTNKFVL